MAGALTIALTIDHLLVMIALLYHFETRLHASTLVINHAFRAYWCAYITLGYYEARWALREPLFFTLLAILAFLLLAIATPE